MTQVGCYVYVPHIDNIRKKIDNSINFLGHADETKFSGFFLEKVEKVG